MPRPFTVLAPMGGTVIALSQVPDPVFAQAMVGAGAAIRPDPGPQEARAPVDGVLTTLHPHAYVVQAEGCGVLVHLGIDTVGLHGDGFELVRAVGDHVRAGDAVLRWDPAAVAARGLATVCPVIVVEADAAGLRLLAEPGGVIPAGAALLSVAASAGDGG